MHRSQRVFPIFLLFFLLSLLIFFFVQSPVHGLLSSVTIPVQRALYGISRSMPETISETQLQSENTALKLQLAKMQEIQNDNAALHGQFAQSTPNPKTLLPAAVIGMRNDVMIIDKGQAEKVQVGDVCIVKDNLIGIVSKVTPHLSIVTLISNPATSFTARTLKTNASGVMHSFGSDSMFLDTVVLSDKLQKDDLVITKGDVAPDGTGFPPDLVVGKVSAIHRKTSDLFQRAEVTSLVDFAKLRLVFVQVQ